MTSHKTPQVAIIGAGLSGLTAAYRLSQQGISAKIFEARERAGGKAFTYYAGSTFEELGGKLLHYDDDATHIHTLLAELGLKIESSEIPCSSQPYYKNGEAHDYYAFFKNGPLPNQETYDQLVKQAHKSRTMQDVLQWFFADHPELLHTFTLRLMNYEGPTTDNLGIYFVDPFWKFYIREYENAAKQAEGGTPVLTLDSIQGGASRLVYALCAKLKGTIHYRRAMQGLYRNSSGNLTIEFEDGSSESFDKVIFAIPCSILRNIEVEPSLIPSDQIEAIHSLEYGTLGKILLPVRGRQEDAWIAHATNFISIFNKDRSFLTLYCSDQSLWLSFHDLYVVEKKLQEILQMVKTLYPCLEITGEPILINWALEPYSKGSYSHFGIDQFDRFNQKSIVFEEEVKHAFRPVDEQIFFAGEHTAFKYYATLEGAVESGDRAARMVMKSFARQKCSSV